MPYATLEEAWGSNFFVEMPPVINANNMDAAAVYESHARRTAAQPNKYSAPYDPKSIGQCVETMSNTTTGSYVSKKRRNRIPNMSRTYERLNEHSGVPNRGNTEPRLIMGEDNQYQLANPQNLPNYFNTDAPISPYTRDLKERMEEHLKTSGTGSNSLNDFLVKENNRLKSMVEDMKKNMGNERDTVFDLLIFLLSGIFVIIIVDSYTKLIKKY